MDKRKSKGLSVGIAAFISFLIIMISVVVTGYFSLKEIYAGNNIAYSQETIKNLSEDGLDHTFAKLFYTDEEINKIKNGITIEKNVEQINEDGIEIHKIKGTTYEAFMMIVHNPEDIILAANPNMDSGAAAPGIEDYIEMYDGIAGINAGGFEDAGGHGNGGQAWGIVISDGELISGGLDEFTTVIGINQDNQLICNNMSARQALEWGIRDGVTFGPALIDQYNVVFEGGGQPQLNPRTVIGQREDGAFLLLVVDGRQPHSLGAKYEDIIQIMQDFNAMTAGNLDGGNSSVLVYNGEYVNTTVSMYGARNLPTAFIVKDGK